MHHPPSVAPPSERPLFFYGSLRDPEMLACVCGRADPDSLDMRPAVWNDVKVSRVAGESFPMAFAHPGGSAVGVVTFGLSDLERRRIGFFEDSDYALTPVTVQMGDGTEGVSAVEAAVYMPTEKLRSSGEPWRLEDWPAAEKALLMACAEEQLSYLDHVPQHIVEQWWPDIKTRAERRIGQTPPSVRHGFDRAEVVEHGRAEPYAKFFRATEVSLTHPSFRGGSIGPIDRAAWRVGDVTTVLPYDPAADTLVLVEQFRAPIYLAGEQNPWIIEAIAGRIDPGEAPEAAARREAQEEAGVALGALETQGVYYSAPGASDERVFAFVGRADLSGAGGVHGLAAEAEDIRVLHLSFWEAMAAMARGEIMAGPAMLALHWLARNRERLIATWP